VRRLVAAERLAWDAAAPFDSARTLAEALLTPTRIYVKPVLDAIGNGDAVKAVAHITGGGLTENLPRVLPAGLAAHVDLASWKAPAVFGWLARTGKLDDAQMLRTFNCGIGLVLVVARSEAETVVATLAAAGETPIMIGEVEPGRGVKSQAKGKGEAEAVRYSDTLSLGQ
jgi:phosphoribosylformylglycinamidine cyclo-ligase